MDSSAPPAPGDRVSAQGDVLIVDDDQDMLEAIELLLRGGGYTTRTALSGRQALDAVAAPSVLPALLEHVGDAEHASVRMRPSDETGCRVRPEARREAHALRLTAGSPYVRPRG